jgi:hypothetical protein
MLELRTAESGSDFCFVERDPLEEIAATLIKLVPGPKADPAPARPDPRYSSPVPNEPRIDRGA